MARNNQGIISQSKQSVGDGTFNFGETAARQIGSAYAN